MDQEKAKDKRGSSRFSRNETLLLLRFYIAHPGDFDSIMGEMKENLNHMQQSTREFYLQNDGKNIKQRLREKFHRLSANRLKETNLEISDSSLPGPSIPDHSIDSPPSPCTTLKPSKTTTREDNEVPGTSGRTRTENDVDEDVRLM
ncbi:Hypothetical predicted protein [Mytilus galloprovincialis]|uniref:Uncharacterized protein n=1 Tax=Mytilus galloprovincialis TaxID=29158 RepID=A0A8B6FK78_MYTGA|nr:Hypothetical predicted protein [Mytilus galloprovincialis]